MSDRTKLYVETGHSGITLMMISPLVYKSKRQPSREEFSAFHEGLRALLREYLKAHGIEVSDEELAHLLVDKIPEGLVSVQQGLSSFSSLEIQSALERQQSDGQEK